MIPDLDQPPARPLVYVWQFLVEDGSRDAFIRAYGPNGDWEKLFRRAEGYLGTLLLNDQTQEQRFLTSDRWASEQANAAFMERFGDAYRALDRQCEAQTVAEKELGCY